MSDLIVFCPACEATVEGANRDTDAWYCPNGDCEVVLFGPRGLNDE